MKLKKTFPLYFRNVIVTNQTAEVSVFQELVVVVHKNNIALEFIFGEDYLALASNNIANHDYGSLSSHTMKNKLFNSLRE